jgi:hypothetical protein
MPPQRRCWHWEIDIDSSQKVRALVCLLYNLIKRVILRICAFSSPLKDAAGTDVCVFVCLCVLVFSLHITMVLMCVLVSSLWY